MALVGSETAANPALIVLAVTMLSTFVATLLGIFVDHRVITEAPAWLKPAKFAISVSIYCFPSVWMLGFVENRPRKNAAFKPLYPPSLFINHFCQEASSRILTGAGTGLADHLSNDSVDPDA